MVDWHGPEVEDAFSLRLVDTIDIMIFFFVIAGPVGRQVIYSRRE